MDVTDHQPGVCAVRRALARDGACVVPSLVAESVVSRLEACIDRIVAGTYPSGRSPPHRTEVGATNSLCRVWYPHVADVELLSAVADSALGAFVSRVLASRWVQAWFIHSLQKESAGGGDSTVGWHQDGQYTADLFAGDFVTATISLSRVTEHSGAVRYVRRSHRGPLITREHGSGFSHIGSLDELRDRLRERMELDAWEETTLCPHRGSVTLHHSRVIHGSPPSTDPVPRKTLVLHLRTEQNPLIVTRTTRRMSTGSFDVDFEDLVQCPLIHGEAEFR